jgi:hypothetical protein
MTALFSARQRWQRAPRFQRHRIEYEKVASSHEQREAAMPGYNIPSSSFAGGCSDRDNSGRTFLNLSRNCLNEDAWPAIGTGSTGDIILRPLIMCDGNPGGFTPWHKLDPLLLVNRATTTSEPVHYF